MSNPYVIFGSEMSPYSVKVRSYFRFKGLDHIWTPRTAENEADYRRHARLPIIPTVVSPSGEGMQDSTPIIETLESRHPEPSIHPLDPALKFVSELLEEFGDEWGNKLMFHHRWFAPVDQLASAQTLARLSAPRASADAIADRAEQIRARMVSRVHFVGSSPENAPLITGYFEALMDVLQPHLADRTYLLGARPSLGDFGLAAQLFEALIDPTCGATMRARAPAVVDWCLRMNAPREEGPFETWETLTATLAPVLSYVGAYFLPWADANARALETGASSFTVVLPGGPYEQPPQKYHAKSLAELRRKFAFVDDAGLQAILAATGCLDLLRA